MPFRERFETMRVTPQTIADSVIDEAGQRVQNGGTLDRIGQEVEARYPGLAARMRECLRSPLRSSKQLDFAFFRMIVEENQ